MTVTRKPMRGIRDEVAFYDHQADGIRALTQVMSKILADEMGLGKSLQAIVTGVVGLNRSEATRILIVCPATLKGNWGDELDKHTTMTWQILDGTPRQRARQLAEFDSQFLIVNYEQVKVHLEELNAMAFGLIIYDEAHILRHRPLSAKALAAYRDAGKKPTGSSARAIACSQLVAPRHLPLTGSPMLNQVDDLWALLHRIAPRQFPNWHTFVNRYAVYGGYKDKQIVGVKNERELRELLKDHMIRREKKDCLDLPAKQRIVVKLDLHPAQRAMYDQARYEMKIDLPDGELEIKNALAKFLYLKEICGTTACMEGHDDVSTKLDRATEMVKEIIDNGEPVVVFTQFRTVLACARGRLEREGIGVDVLHGDVPTKDRVPLVRAWSEHAAAGRPRALLCMLQVGGIGLNMTAASKMIFLDKLFVPKLNEQAEDRIHRIGADTTKPVQIYELQMRNTIEQRIEMILRQKTTVFGAVVEVGNSEWKKQLIAAVINDEQEEVA